MHTYKTVWNDSAKRREIELHIHYRVVETKAEVLGIAPQNVVVYEVEGESVYKQIPVHTEGGRRLLTKTYLAGRDSARSIEEEVLVHHASKDDPLADALIA